MPRPLSVRELLTPRRLLYFGLVWLMVGFASGTLILLGPAEWVTSGVTRAGGGEGARSGAMIAVILLYVAASFVFSVWLTRVLLTGARIRQTGGLAVLTALAGLALWGWSNPARFAALTAGEVAGGEVLAAESGARFLFGPYPDRSALAELKDAGVTAVVSLQHPAVVPIEPQGIAAEKEAARDIGIEFIHAPMLPWISDNEASLDLIRDLVRKGDGTYYIHCGLGRDRVGVVRRTIESMGVTTAGDLETALTWGDREAEGLGDLERGPPIEVDDEVWLVPFPNEYEMFGHMLAGQVAHVVLALDASRPDEAEWADTARRQFDTYDIPYTDLTAVATDELGARIATEAADLPRPLTIIVGHTTEEAADPRAAAVRRGWD